MLGHAIYNDESVFIMDSYYSAAKQKLAYLIITEYECRWVKETDLTNITIFKRENV
jgi:hypothetical protein